MFKKCIPLLLLLSLLTGCTPDASAPGSTPAVPTEAPTVPVTESPTLPVTEPPTEVPTQPPHSALYMPDVCVEDVILYFSEVCLDAEITNSGDPSVLQKWVSPICYHISGEPTAEDLEKLRDFAQWLNTIEGFPGMYEATGPEEANLRIHFCDQDTMIDLMGDNFYGMDGAVTFWYMDNIIYDAIITYRTDLDQHLRNSVILEEIYNGLGPVQDTGLRPDSIIYSGFSEPQVLTEMDRLILKLLYHPDLKCGMDQAACEAVIRDLYY